MSGFFKSEEELAEEQRHEAILAEIQRGAAKQAHVTREAAKTHVEAIQESSRRQTRANAQALERQAAGLVQATQDSAEFVADRLTRAIAEEWVLQARGKTRRAYELLIGEMKDEAWQLAKEAIQQDPGYLPAYGVAALLHEIQGEVNRSDHFYKKQIGLLRVTPYDQDLRWPISVLRSLPNRSHLLAEFRTTAEFLLATNRWRDGDWESFILLLRGRNLQRLAKTVTEVALGNKATLKLHALYLELSSLSEAACQGVENYLNKPDFSTQKRFVVEYHGLKQSGDLAEVVTQTIYAAMRRSQLSSLTKYPSMADYAFHFDFSLGWSAAQESFEKYLTTTSTQRQNEFLSQLAEVFRNQKEPSSGLLLMRSILGRQFENWQPIRQQHREKMADARAKAAVKGTISLMAVLVGASALLLFMGAFFATSSVIVRLAMILTLAGGLTSLLMMWGILMRYKQRLIERKFRGLLHELWTAEKAWGDWLGIRIPGPLEANS